MKIYEVEYIKQNKKHKIFLKADNRTHAMNLAKRNGTITKLGETKSVPLAIKFEEGKDKLERLISGGKVKMPKLITSIRQIAVMTNAGIPITEAIKEVANSSDDKRLKEIFGSVNEMLDNGQSLTASMEKFRVELGDIVIAMVKLGESTGKLSESLSKLADILDDVWKNTQNVKKAMRYPTIMMFAIAGAFIFLMLVIVPKFKEIFDQLGANLPLPTLILLNIESVLSNYGFILLGVLIALYFFIKSRYNNSDSFKAKVDTFVIKRLYLIKEITFFSSMYRFNLIFTELITAGIPIAKALDTASMTVSNFHLNKRLSMIAGSIKNGKNFTQSVEETQVYENMLIAMIKAGEKGGNLEGMMEKISDYYKSKFDDIIDNISSYIEPILIFAIAGMVVLLALGIFMPMWDLGRAVKGG